MNRSFHALALMLALTAVAPAAARAPAEASAATSATRGDYQRDRASILAMAGDYRVRFNFAEMASFLDGYIPLEPKHSGGNEIVRVVADDGKTISLQHILVIEGEEEGQYMVVKHWRQDWTWEPATLLRYAGKGQWRLDTLGRDERRGAWSQTVWQTDDSPRYGGVGRWTYDYGVPTWTSDTTLRPLARRDAVRKPPYDRYSGENRHLLSPTGWVHEQDNAKLGEKDGKLVTYVHEDVTNRYERFKDFNVARGESYWAKTKDYWAAVRAEWDRVIVAGKGVHLTEEPQFGALSGPRLMGYADEIEKGTMTTPDAIEKARAVIAEVTAR